MQQAPQISPDGYWMWNGGQWVPNPYRPMGAPLLARPFESAGFRATMTTVFLIANAVGVGLGTSWDFVNISYLQTPAPDQGFTALWGLLALADLVMVYATFIPATVFFSMWVHRVVRNMPALGSPDWRRSPGWSVGSSFIPVVNLAYPYLAVLDAWRASEPGSRWLNLAARKASGVPVLLVGWWSLWLLGVAASRAAYFLERYGDTSGKIAGSFADIANAVFLIGAAIVGVAVVRELTARQERKNYMIASGQLV
jgi:hypothetical protein